jgi:uncharacterized membrane protein YeiB
MHAEPHETNAFRDSELPELAPISTSERINTLDMLRGFALIGILMMNIEWFNRAISEGLTLDYSLTGADWVASWSVKLFVEGKFYKLFSLLFGMGFAVMLLRAKDTERPFGAWFIRRMGFLYLFGICHLIFLWEGDILNSYAIGGLFLLAWIYITRLKLMRFFSGYTAFLRMGIVITFLPIFIGIGLSLYFGNVRSMDVITDIYEQNFEARARAEIITKDTELSEPLIKFAEALESGEEEEKDIDEDSLEQQDLIEYKAEQYFIEQYLKDKDIANERAAFTQDSYWVATKFRFKRALFQMPISLITGLLVFFPLFLIGYWFVASGVIREPRKHLLLFKTMAWIGLPLGLFFSAGGLLIIVHPVTAHADQINIAANFIFNASQYLVTAGYLGVFVLICLTATGHRLFSWMAPMGRMALTNYIMNSVVLTTIFYGYAGGMFSEIGRAKQLGMVFGIIATQALLSFLWLKLFRFGPLEWLWRSLSYWKIQPILRQ